MRDGFSSIADLKVIVDANAEKFHSGLRGVEAAVANLNSRGGESFRGMQGLVDTLGSTLLGTTGKMKALVIAAQAGVAVYQQLVQQGREFAVAVGAEKQYDDLVQSLGNLGMTLQDTVVSSLFAVQAATVQTSQTFADFSQDTEVAADKSESFAQRVVSAVAMMVKDVNASLKSANAESYAESSGPIEEAIKTNQKLLDDWRKRLAEFEAENPDGLLGRFMNGNQITLAKSRIEELTNQIERLKRVAATKPQDINADLPISLLGEQIAAEEKRVAALGKSRGELARLKAEEDAVNTAKRLGITLSEGQIKNNEHEAKIIGDLVAKEEAWKDAKQRRLQAEREAEQRSRSEERLVAGAERQVQQINARTRALELNAGAAAELAMKEQLLLQMRTTGVPLNRENLLIVEALSHEYGMATERLAEHTEQLQEMREIGSSVAGELSSAFSRWANGSKLSVKDMVASILADLAQLTLRRSVLDPLFGGGGDQSGGLLGSLLGGLFQGSRATGGPVDRGQSYLVGEHGPETFVPNVNGNIVPNASSGATTPTVNVVTNIDARGATADAIQELKTEMAARDARLPQQILSVVQQGRERGLT